MSKKGFSLAELMIVLLIMTIILAATMPILSKRAKVKAAATASVHLPVVSEDEPCTSGNIGISADGTSLLTCQGGVWKKLPSSGGAGSDSLYLYSSDGVATPPVCSSLGSDWADAGYTTQSYFQGIGGRVRVMVRACYNTNKTCSTLYLNSTLSCPDGWTDAGTGVSGYSVFNATDRDTASPLYSRSCYKCS